MGIYGKEDFELMIHMRKVNLAVLAVLTGMFPLNLEILSLSLIILPLFPLRHHTWWFSIRGIDICRFIRTYARVEVLEFRNQPSIQ